VDLRRVIVGHLGDRRSIDIPRRVGERGAFIGVDNIGNPGFQREEQRAANVVALIREGFGDQVLLSMDVCNLADLHWYGGKGFDYLLRTFVPLLHQLGATDDEVRTLLVDNPRRALAFAPP
jgi:phosphotriesterase-related protein